MLSELKTVHGGIKKKRQKGLITLLPIGATQMHHRCRAKSLKRELPYLILLAADFIQKCQKKHQDRSEAGTDSGRVGVCLCRT